MLTKLKLGVGAAVLLVVAGLIVGVPLPKAGNKDGNERVAVLLTVTQKLLRPEKGVLLLITYKSSSTEWRGPVKHYPVIEGTRKRTDPWNKTVSVKRGDTVYLRSHQGIANEQTCLISVPSMRGVWSKAVTRRSIGTVKCELQIP